MKCLLNLAMTSLLFPYWVRHERNDPLVVFWSIFTHSAAEILRSSITFDVTDRVRDMQLANYALGAILAWKHDYLLKLSCRTLVGATGAGGL